MGQSALHVADVLGIVSEKLKGKLCHDNFYVAILCVSTFDPLLLYRSIRNFMCLFCDTSHVFLVSGGRGGGWGGSAH